MSEGKEPFSGKNDPLYDEAVKLVRERKKVSVSMLQRHLRIGYIRSSSILEAMVGTVISEFSPTATILPE